MDISPGAASGAATVGAGVDAGAGVRAGVGVVGVGVGVGADELPPLLLGPVVFIGISGGRAGDFGFKRFAGFLGIGGAFF